MPSLALAHIGLRSLQRRRHTIEPLAEVGRAEGGKLEGTHSGDLGKLKTWSQAIAAGVGGLAAAGVWSDDVAWWALLVALVLTWVSGLDYARVAPRVLRGESV